jgi:kinesin family protein 1
MNTREDYVKGEEDLADWTPRGVSLVKDYIGVERRRRRIAEIELARTVLSPKMLSIAKRDDPSTDIELDDRRKALLTRMLKLWSSHKAPESIILSSQNLEPPTAGAAFAPRSPSRGNSPAPKPSLTATVRFISKNPNLLKASFLLTPDPTNTRWVRRYVEFRKPYLHVYSVDGDELNAINLTNARVNHSPEIARLFNASATSEGSRGHSRNKSIGESVTPQQKDTIFAVFAKTNTYVFRAKSEREKIEWILRIDQGYFSSEGEDSGSS